MATPINVLIVEDSPDDAALLVRELRSAGFEPAWKRVETEADYRARLEELPDVIISDYTLPQFSGLRAMDLLRERGLDMPFILVSGTVGEEKAVEAMKHGVTDYLLKDRLGRLGNAVERALAQQRLRGERGRMQQQLTLQATALETAANAILITDRTGTILWVNAAFSTVTGYAADEAMGKTPRLLKSGKHDQKFYDDFWQTITGGKTWRGEFINRRKDGKTYYDEHTVTPVRSQAGKITHFIAIMNDVTEKKRLEEQFVQAQKMEVVGQLAGGVAHDFNNILAIIMGYALMLLEELGPEKSLRSFAEEIRNAGERATALTRQLLVFSRKQTLQPVVLDLNEVVASLDKMLRRLVDESIELKVAPGKQIGRVLADSGYLGQVLMNLIVNARDAMPDGGKLTIETGNATLDEDYARAHAGVKPGDYVMFAVSDTGTGLTEEVKARLFEAFFTTKPAGKGTGLGLSTCDSIVRQSGGHIGVYSELRKGTTFKVYLPRVDQPLDEAAWPIQKGPLSRGTETLLVVEDEPSLRHLAASVLQAQGYTVLRATSGQDGLRVAREHKGQPIRLVFTDVVMPQMGGQVMAEWLTSTYPDLKVLFTSGYTDAAISHHGVLNQDVAFLAKPYTPATLARKVRDMLDE